MNMVRDTEDDSAVTDAAGRCGIEPHGKAAIMLVESLIHSLIERSVLSVNDAIDIVETVIDVKLETALERGEAMTSDASLDLLIGMVSSMRRDDHDR